MRSPIFLLTAVALGCATARPPAPAGADKEAQELGVPDAWDDPAAGLPERSPTALPTSPRIVPSPVAITNAKILTGSGRKIERGTIVVRGGKIAAIGGPELAVPGGIRKIDAGGRWVTPGIIDSHSHIGVYPVPEVRAHADGNEMSKPTTPSADAAYGYWPQDPAITHALAGGVTTALVLPGSGNLIGGRAVVVEMHPGRGIAEVAFPGAPRSIKMACGENPKRVHGPKGGPMTRMGTYAAFRAEFQKAAEYDAKWRAYRVKHERWSRRRARAEELTRRAADGDKPRPAIKAQAAPEAPARDGDLEVLAAVLRGEILVQVHCYRADEMLQMLAIADEFGFEIRSFHHSLEAYKIRDVLARRRIGVSTWADWWGFKIEAFDGIPENAALVAEAGGRPIIHSDSAIGIQRLNQEAAKALAAGLAAGAELTEHDALRWITAYPAWALGIDDVTGTLEPGKRGDLVIWSGYPLSVYALADLVFIGGHLAYDRKGPGRPATDFELGVTGTRATEPAAPAGEKGDRS